MWITPHVSFVPGMSLDPIVPRPRKGRTNNKWKWKWKDINAQNIRKQYRKVSVHKGPVGSPVPHVVLRGLLILLTKAFRLIGYCTLRSGFCGESSSKKWWRNIVPRRYEITTADTKPTNRPDPSPCDWISTGRHNNKWGRRRQTRWCE